VFAQLPGVSEHFNEDHPHSALKWQSPRLFRKALARQPQENDANEALAWVWRYRDKITFQENLIKNVTSNPKK
jgi:transposase InsO family protein